MKKFAIIGFGGAGCSAAREIRRRDPSAVIDVFSDTDVGPCNPMLTTYYVKGAIPRRALFPFGSLAEVTAELGINFHGKRPVTGVKPEEKMILFPDGEAGPYDAILISTGSSAVVPPLEGINLPGVFKMRTAQDAEALKASLADGKIKSALVIGASWVGIKVIEDLVEAGVESTLVDGAGWMFFVAAFAETSKRVQRDLEAKGIRVSCGQMLDHIEAEAEGGITAVMKGGDRFTADTIAMCIGVRTNTGFLRESGIAQGRGVTVDSRMRTNYPGVYAAGDCCEAVDIQSGLNRNIGVWYNAKKQGLVAGNNMTGGDMEFGANILANLAHYLDYDFMCVGDVSACREGDELYEYEDGRYYIRAVKDDNGIKCINVIGSADSNGVIKNTFIKSIENKNACLDVRTVCFLQEKGFPDSFTDFLGGKSVD